MFGHQRMEPAQKHLGGQITAQLAAERAGNRNRQKGELLCTRRHIPAAAFARDNELLAILNAKTHCDFPPSRLSIGEERAKIQNKGAC